MIGDISASSSFSLILSPFVLGFCILLYSFSFLFLSFPTFFFQGRERFSILVIISLLMDSFSFFQFSSRICLSTFHIYSHFSSLWSSFLPIFFFSSSLFTFLLSFFIFFCAVFFLSSHRFSFLFHPASVYQFSHLSFMCFLSSGFIFFFFLYFSLPSFICV